MSKPIVVTVCMFGSSESWEPQQAPHRWHSRAGVYGVNPLGEFQRAASYGDRILKGAKPSELPVQAPDKFKLVINLKTAKALGLGVPLFLRQRADDVIE